MTIEELFRAFTDVDFRYTRFIKTRDYERTNLEKFDALIESIRLQTLKMDLSPGINDELQKTGRLDLDFFPRVSFLRKFLGFLTFGLSKRRFIERKIHEYYLKEIHQRYLLVQSIQNHLAQE